ncbi:MAG: 4-hydroxy-tetrahydrodipicolinate reductase, partial [Mesobacillus sp.]
MKNVKIVIAGPRGRMGREAVQLVLDTENYELAAVVDRKHEGMKVGEIDGFPQSEALVYTDFEKCLQEIEPDVLIDLTTPEVGMFHTKTALKYKVRP